MRKVETCVKCGSADIVHRATVVHRNQNQEQSLNLRVDANPAALVFKKSARSILHAEVCSECGYTEFYADDPAALFSAFSESQAQSPARAEHFSQKRVLGRVLGTIIARTDEPYLWHETWPI